MPSALICWAIAAWAVAQPVAALTVAAATVAVILLATATAVLLRRRGRSGPLAAGALLTSAAVLALLAVQAGEAARRDAEPVRGWSRDRAVARIQAVAVGDATRVRGQAFAGPPRYVTRVSARSIEARGLRVEVAAPLLVLGGPGWSQVTAGTPVGFVARLGPAERADGVAAVASAVGGPRAGTPAAVWRAADRLRSGLRAACAGLGDDPRGLLPALVVGDTANLPQALVEDLRASGLTHLTAVSGANVAIVVGAALWFVSALGVGRSARVWLALVAVAGFVVLARPQPSVLRAAVMGCVALAGLLRGRRVHGVPVVAASVVLLLVALPRLARSPGFALSVAATTALVLLAPPWADRLQRWMPRPAALALAVPAAAQAACGPIVVLLDPALPTVAVPANLLAGPAVPAATVCGVLAAVLSPVWSGAAAAVAWCGGVAAGWIAVVAHRAAAVPGAALPWVEGPAGAVLLLALTAGMVLLTLRVEPAPDGTARVPGGDRGGTRVSFALALAVCAVALVAGWFVGPVLVDRTLGARSPGGGWAVAMCDVGQGDMLVLRSGVASAVVVDVGPDPPAADRCLRRLGVRALDLVVLTHFHADHVLGLPGALRGRAVGPVVTSGLAEPAENAEAVRRWAAEAGTSVHAGSKGEGGTLGDDDWSVAWRVLAAYRPAVAGSATAAGRRTAEPENSEVNESSVVVEAVVTGRSGAVRVVALGDLGAAGQSALAAALRREPLLGGPVDVVKVAHHGSAAQDPELYAALAAPVALIGVGTGNDYGHPAPRTLDLLAAAGSTPLRTDTGGTVRLVPSAAGLAGRSLLMLAVDTGSGVGGPPERYLSRA